MALTILNTLLTGCIIAGLSADAAFVNLGVSMRKFSMAVLAAPFAAVFTVAALPSVAFADSAMVSACRAQAAAVADDYMSDEMMRLDGTESAGEGHIIVHSYGRKYLMANNVPGEGRLVRRSIGTTTQEWGKVYMEERRRCLRLARLSDFYSNN